MLRVLAIADDLTGMLETAAKFAGRGAGADATVLNADSRHLSPEQAKAAIRSLAVGTPDLVYKKTDSTLRGNIGAELSALLQLWPETPLFFVPAYPALGRTVRDGALFLEGVPLQATAFARDPLNPIRTNRIRDVLAEQTSAQIYSAGARATLPGIHIFDGEKTSDVQSAARMILRRDGIKLVAGPAAIAEALAELLWPNPPLVSIPPLSSALIVNGSLHERSIEQIANGRSAAASWTIFDDAGVLQGTGVERAANLGQLVATSLAREPKQLLIVFGGDTAAGILGALGNPIIEPLREILPGVPISKLVSNDGRTRFLVTKAGGFGPPDVLKQIRDLLCQHQ